MLLKVVDGLIILAVSAFTLLSLAFIFVMWRIRQQFFIALRSPLLACWCGVCLSLVTCSATLEYVIAWGGRSPTDDGIVDLVGLPMVLAAEVFAIMRAIRVLLLYYPSKRKAWGGVPKEKPILVKSAWAYALMEIVLWSAAAALGIPRAGHLASSVVAPVAFLTALISFPLLGVQLVKVDDMCGLGREALRIGMFIIGALFMYVGLYFVPTSGLAFKYSYVAFAAIRNVIPVRDFLKHADSKRPGPGGFYLIFGGTIPWRIGGHTMQRVVAFSTASSRPASQASSCFDGHAKPLDDIMNFLPLREAFREFCRKALCSESFDFLVAVADFKQVVHAAFDPNDKVTAAGEDFDKYLAIVKEYVETKSPCEVNIDDHARREALLYTEQHDYISLGQEHRSAIFLLAERQISDLLMDNLVARFRASALYKELIDHEHLKD